MILSRTSELNQSAYFRGIKDTRGCEYKRTSSTCLDALMAQPLRKDRSIKIRFLALKTAQLSSVHSVSAKAVYVFETSDTQRPARLLHSSSDFLLVPGSTRSLQTLGTFKRPGFPSRVHGDYCVLNGVAANWKQ